MQMIQDTDLSRYSSLTKSVKQEASTLLTDKIDKRQGGIPTYYDNYLMGCIADERVEELKEFIQIQHIPRFEKYEHCHFKQASENEVLLFIKSQGVTRCFQWHGTPLFKSAFDFMLYHEIICHIKPALIIEFGSGNQSSARWLSSLCQQFRCDSKIVSIDITNTPSIHENIIFIKQDCTLPGAIENIFNLVSKQRHPALIIDDMHICTSGILRVAEKFMEPGDYIFIEDAIQKHHTLAQHFDINHHSKLRLDNYFMNFFGSGICKKSSIILTNPGQQ
jgi:cephalosporin hydroxylase